jgi:hypothetical protein
MKFFASYQMQCWQTVFLLEIANFLQLQTNKDWMGYGANPTCFSLFPVIALVYPRVEGANKKRPRNSRPFPVVWGGIEPPTHGFSVHCSTD